MMVSRTRFAPRTGHGGGWLSAKVITAVLVAVLVVLPLVMLTVGSLRTAAPGQPGTWSTHALFETYGSSATYIAIRNSLVLAGASVAISTALGLTFAWLATRGGVPGRRLLTPVMMLLVAFPPLLYALSWNLLGAKEIGLLAKAGLGWFDINSWSGVIMVVALKGTGFAYLLLLGPVSKFDTTVIESARVFGASAPIALWRIAIPILRPAILSATVLNMIVAFAMFDIPQIIGFPAGIRFFSTSLFQMLSSAGTPQYNTASALALSLVVLLVVLAYAQGRLVRDGDFTTVGGRGTRTETAVAGRAKWVGTATITGFAVLAVAAPVTQLVIGAFQPVFGVYTGYTTANFRDVLSDPQVINALWVTLRAASISALTAMMLAFAIAYLAARRADRTSRLLEASLWLPWAMPGIVLALGITWAVVELDVLHPLYGTNVLLLAGLVVVALPIAARTARAAIAQISPVLEEAGRVSGASAAAAFRHIVLRLVATSFYSGWFLGFIMVAGVLDLPLVLAGRSDPPLPVVLYTMSQNGHTAQAAAVCVLLIGAVLIVAVSVAGLRRALRWRTERSRQRTEAAHHTTETPPHTASGAYAVAAQRS